MYRRYLHAIMHEKERVDRQIEREQSAPNADWRRLLKLKKLRLALKDRIQNIIADERKPGSGRSPQTYATPMKEISSNR